ncbi:MAG: hypothetical protein QM796_11845 [Chthoniobacteraceae bacterium]
MITGYDYFIIAVYLLFVLAIGLAFRRMSKNTSDYFRAGGAMPWWITGTSAWIASFTAWTFTGAAGKVYETGTLVLVVFYAASLAMVMVMAFTCLRFRRMRVVTWMEAVRLRYGPFTEQFYTWIKLPLLVFVSGVSLNAIGVFMASVFHVEMNHVLIVLGIVVTIVAFAGGAWAVLASDFVQMFLVMTITISTAVLVLVRPDIGGFTGLLAKVPSYHFHWTELARTPLIAMWVVVMIWFKFSDMNNMENSTMYLMAGSDRDARRMVLIPMIGSLLGPVIWFIPSMAATILHPDSDPHQSLKALFPQLSNPHEAAFVSVALQVMPQGLLGLLLCGMLGATVTSMDAGLNKSVGIFVRSFYLPVGNAFDRWGIKLSTISKWQLFGKILRRISLCMMESSRSEERVRNAFHRWGTTLSSTSFWRFFGELLQRISAWMFEISHLEKRLLLVGKITTLAFGVIIVSLALLVNKYRTIGLFDLSNQIASYFLMPLALPLIFGLFYKRTPLWSAWTTAVVGGIASWAFGNWIKPTVYQHFMGWQQPLNGDEVIYLRLCSTTLGAVGVGSLWYFATSLFYRSSPAAHKAHVEEFFTRLRTPVENTATEAVQESLYRLLGVLCLVYGAFVLLLTLIPNSIIGRLCFVFCGGSIFIAGLILYLISRRYEAARAKSAPPAETENQPSLTESQQ